MLYHVSKNSGLTVLEPQVSTHGKAYVYAIEDLITDQLIIHRYRQNPEYKAFISRHIVDRLIRSHALDCIKTDTRFQNYFGKIIQELQYIMDGHLLD